VSEDKDQRRSSLIQKSYRAMASRRWKKVACLCRASTIRYSAPSASRCEPWIATATFELEADGLLAVCIQHEIDHLDGKLFVDYLSSLKRQRIKRNWRRRAVTAIQIPSPSTTSPPLSGVLNRSALPILRLPGTIRIVARSSPGNRVTMRIIFAGTPEFAVPTLRALLASAHTVVAVYTQRIDLPAVAANCAPVRLKNLRSRMIFSLSNHSRLRLPRRKQC